MEGGFELVNERQMGETQELKLTRRHLLADDWEVSRVPKTPGQIAHDAFWLSRKDWNSKDWGAMGETLKADWEDWNSKDWGAMGETEKADWERVAAAVVEADQLRRGERT